ncbi:hypothetical protein METBISCDRAFT_27013 [Metschnikowia bicuspidata]|uniref:PCI domain-containing protein n=1 Tax=Metschnikowia bicuspidata TaxID=27322 RepID=A0A4P9ZFJ1_9ASCO|nr:hypothetical protein METBISCDRAFT_27013 [Metschnikowia bicuspidata]
MDQHKVLHPVYPQISRFLHENSDCAADFLKKYGLEWAAAIRDAEIASKLDNSSEMAECTDKADVLAQFLPKFSLLFVLADFSDLLYQVHRIGLVVEFRLECTDHQQFAENRYFEVIYYYLLAILYGQLWFPNYSVLEEAAKIAGGTVGTKSWQQLEKSAASYHKKCQHLVKSLSDRHQDHVDGINRELRYYDMICWLCSFAHFKDNRFVDFVKDFDSLGDKIPLLESISMKQEAILMYQIANVATKNFCELVSCESESLMELYSGTTFVEAAMLSYLGKLAEADFPGAKRVFNADLVKHLDARIAYALPRKLAGSFWRYFTVIVDLKVFLLLLSCALLIPKEKLLDKIGYRDSSAEERDAVSASLIMVTAALSLGKVNVTYDEVQGVYRRGPVTDSEKLMQLKEELDDLDHVLEAEAVAQLVQARLVERLCS